MNGAALVVAAAALLAAGPVPEAPPPSRPDYLNPAALAVSADERTAYVALAGTRTVVRVDLAQGKVDASWSMAGPPLGLAVSANGRELAVTLGEAQGEIAILKTADGTRLRGWAGGFSPVAPVYVMGGRVLAHANRHTHRISFHEAGSGKKLGEVPTGREPVAAVPSADGRRLFVGTLMPAQAATADHVAGTVEVIDAARRKRLRVIDLPNGSTGLHALAVSPDGKWVLATHILGHYQVPTNQLERGWMNANALTVIDAERMEILGTALLDDTTLGAANPWGVGVSADGAVLAVAHAGTHELSRIPFPRFLEILQEVRSRGAAGAGGSYGIERDLTVMVRSGRTRIRMPGEGPRELAFAGMRALVLEYFSGRLVVADLSDSRTVQVRPIVLGPEPAIDTVRKGELRFTDARLCFQAWQSCISCHPAVRADGLNWDLLNDGIGNPKQTKSMVFSHVTPLAMGHGIRASAEVAVRAGIRFIQFAEVVEEEAASIDEYLKSLRPLPSPFLVEGRLGREAERGREIFERVGCADCHTGPYFTDLKSYKVRHATGQDADREFDTPTLREAWRTAPYLYDGRAATMEEALRIKSKWTRDLDEAEIRALAAYVLSL